MIKLQLMFLKEVSVSSINGYLWMIISAHEHFVSVSKMSSMLEFQDH